MGVLQDYNNASEVNEALNDGKSAKTLIGDLSQLTTTDKTNLVNAINEVISNGAKLQTLTQAQYDALTDAEKNNGTYYCIVEADAT